MLISVVKSEKAFSQLENYKKIQTLKEDTYQKYFDQYQENILSLDKLLIAQTDMLLSQRAAGTVPAYIKMATIQPSFTGSVQSMLIPNFGSNPDGAYVFINYMLSDAAQQILVKEMAAIPLVDVSGMDMTGYEDLKDLDVGSFRTLSIGDLGTNFNERWDNEIGSLG